MINLPDNWAEMGVISQHQWLKNNSNPKPAPFKESIKAINSNTSLESQHFTYAAMVKTDDSSLKNMPDHSERDKRKPSLLNKYREYLTEYMTAKKTYDNNVLFFCMVWACDVGEWDWAIKLCDYAVITSQRNDNFQRGAADIVANELFKVCEKMAKSLVKLPSIWREVFARILGKEWLIDDALQARYLKLEGDIINESEPKLALSYFIKAQELKADIGVKGRIDAIGKLL